MATDTKDFVGQMFTQAGESFRNTMEAGLKMHQQAAKMWPNTTQTPTMFDDFRGRNERFADEYTSTLEANLDQWKRGFETQARTSLDWLRQAFEAAQGQSPADLQTRTQELWQTSFDAVKDSTDSLMKTNSRMFERWNELFTTACTGSEASRATGKKAQA